MGGDKEAGWGMIVSLLLNHFGKPVVQKWPTPLCLPTVLPIAGKITREERRWDQTQELQVG